jgi:hypothetical protein
MVSNTMHTADPIKKAIFTSKTDGIASPIQEGDVESDMIKLLERSLSCCKVESYKNADHPACPTRAIIHAN